MTAAVVMRRDSVVAGQVIGPSSLSLRGGPGRQGQVRLQLAPAGEGVAVELDSEASHLLGDPLPARVRAHVSCELSNQLLRALRKMCVADRVAGRRRGGLELSWQISLSGGLWEVAFDEAEEHPPLERALDALRALATSAAHVPGAEVRIASVPPQRQGRTWLALVALLATLALMALALLVLSGCSDDAGEQGAPSPPPAFWSEGLEAGVNWGLAADYPDDVGIAADPHVLAAEDFETGAVTIVTEEDRYAENVVVTDQQHYSGQYAGEHSWPEGLNGPTTRYLLGAAAHEGDRPAYFMRMCFKYDPSFHPGDPSVGVGVKGFGIYYEDGSGNANTCAGMSWYNTSCQFVGWGPSQKPEANDGFVWEGHMYSYNPYPELAVATLGEIRVTDPPDGTTPCRFSSYPDPHQYIRFEEWSCYELGLLLNTPGKADGESRYWVDGVLRARTRAMRFRDDASQLPNSMHLNLHRTTENFPQTMVRWVDNIVLATRYIGPVMKSR